MALINCPECGKQVSNKAPACPDCGYPINTTSQSNSTQEYSGKKLANLYERARKSLEVDDLEHAAEYYKQILDENPSDWEAYFYSYLGEFPTFTNAQAGAVAEKLGNTIPPAYDMAIQNCTAEEATSRAEIISKKTSDRLVGIASTGAALLMQYAGGNFFTPAGKVNMNLYKQIRPTAVNTVVNSVLAYTSIDAKLVEFLNEGKIDKDKCIECLLYIRRARYQIANMQFEPSVGTTERLIRAELIEEYAKAINEFDPTFESPSAQAAANPSGGCYVATCVYGSYDCPEVWTLRRYRDNTLGSTWYGRMFIRVYYAISPTFVKWFGKTKWFKKLWRGKLDRMVKSLQERGVESTPYCDKEW